MLRRSFRESTGEQYWIPIDGRQGIQGLVCDIAKNLGFAASNGGWYRELPAALFALDLQKSDFGTHYELNLKLFLNRGVPKDAAALKKLIKSMSGDIFRRQPEKYRGAFELEDNMSVTERKQFLEAMFCEVVDKVAAGANAPSGILSLCEQGVLFLLPSVEARLKAGSMPQRAQRQ